MFPRCTDATVFVSEARTRFAKKGEQLDLTKLPSQCAEPKEVVVVIGETRNACQQRMLPMERSASGKFLGFGKERVVNADRLEGRFAILMPEEYPKAKTREMAIVALLKMGVTTNKKENQNERAEDLESSKYHVISPDGIPLTPEPFASKKEALEFIPKWCERFKSQGYFSAVDERIPLDELPDRLELCEKRRWTRQWTGL